MRNLRMMTLFGVLLLLSLSACDTTQLAQLQDVASSASLEDNHIEFSGVLEALGDTSVTVEGQILSIVPESEIAAGLVVGDLVKVEARLLEDGSLVALEVKLLEDPQDESSRDDRQQENEIEFTGEISVMEAASWTIADQPVAILVSTEIHGQFAVGDIVKVHAFLAEDGTLTAREIEAGEASDMGVSISEGSSEGFELTGEVESISDTEWAIAGIVVNIDSATEIHDAIVVGDWVKAEGIVQEDGSFLAIEISLEETSDSSTGGSAKLEFVGAVEAIGADSWTVAGREVPVSPDTHIEDGIAVGDMVKVELLLNADGTITTLEIGFFNMEGDMDSDNDEDDDEEDDNQSDDSDDEQEDEHEDEHESQHQEDNHEDDD